MSTWNKHYHWKTKGCTPWAKSWVQEHLVGQSASGEAGSVRVSALDSFEGDVELGNRKGKLITIYDCEVVLGWTDAEEGVKGTITFPEVSHEVEDEGSEYRHEVALRDSGSNDGQAFVQTVRQHLVPVLLKALHRFREDLISQHASDLGHDGSSATSVSGATTPVASTVPASNAASKPAAAAQKAQASTRTIQQSATLAVSRADLWDLLTNPSKIPMWTKAPAEFSAESGAPYSLFGGNVSGTVRQVQAPSHLSQEWRLAQWPQGHYAELNIELKEGTDATELVLLLIGVPVGDEDQAEQGLERYYLRGLKSLGLGTIL